MNKILSIIIPTYNMEEYLDKCLTSLFVTDKDLMSRLEVLIILDGATDGSLQIAKRYEELLPDTYIIIEKENGNYGSCINRGLQEARGKYVRVLDADDSFDTANFHQYLSFLSTEDCDLVLTPYQTVDDLDRVTSHRSYQLPHNKPFGWSTLAHELLRNHLQMHAVTYKLEKVKGLNYIQTEGISYTDQEWDFTPLYAMDSFVYYPVEVYRYLVGRVGQTVTGDSFAKHLHHNMLCVQKIVRDFNYYHADSPVKWKFLQTECRNSIRTIYVFYLLKYRETASLQEIMEFDNFVKCKTPSIYQELESECIPYVGYPFIHRWRMNPREKLPSYVQFLHQVSLFVQRLRKHMSF